MRRRIIMLIALGLVYTLGMLGRSDDAPLLAPVEVGAQAPCAPPLPPQVRVQNDGADVLWVTVTAASTLQKVRFGNTQNALLDVPRGPVSSRGGSISGSSRRL